MTEPIVAIYSVNTMLCLLLAGHWLWSLAPRPLAARVLGANYLLQACLSALAVQALYRQEGGITLNRAERELGVPARLLSEAINRIHGSGFSQYLNACRVREAQRLIALHPQVSLTELMLDTGFGTKSHFNREFGRIAGVTPSEYRERVTQGRI